LTLYIPEKAMNWNHCTISPKFGEWAEPELGPALPAPAALRDPRDPTALRIRAAPATPRVTYVTDF